MKFAIVAPATNAPALSGGSRSASSVQPSAACFDRRRRRRHHVQRAVLIPGGGQPVRRHRHRQRAAVDEAEVAAAGDGDRGRRAEPVELIEDVVGGAAVRRQRTAEPGQRGDGGGIGRDPAIAGGLAVADAAAGGVEQQGRRGKTLPRGARVALSCFSCERVAA